MRQNEMFDRRAPLSDNPLLSVVTFGIAVIGVIWLVLEILRDGFTGFAFLLGSVTLLAVALSQLDRARRHPYQAAAVFWPVLILYIYLSFKLG
jgi:drug/metabolite transporter (DMT)-like permease